MKFTAPYRVLALLMLPVVLGHPLLVLGQEAAPGPTQAQEPLPGPAALEKAEVRLPGAELLRLWEEARAAKSVVPPEPLPEGLLLAALFRVGLSSGKVGLEAEFRVESFGRKWERIPLMGAGITVASVDPPDARLAVVGDRLCFVAPEAGQTVVKLKFAEIQAPPAGVAPFLQLETAPGAVGQMEVNGVPEGTVVVNAQGVPVGGGLKQGQTRVSLPAQGGRVTLGLLEESRLPKAELPPPPPPLSPSEWALQNEVLVQEGEGELSFVVHTDASALNGSALEAVLLLPPNARGVTATGEDLAEVRPARTEEGRTELRLRWKTRDIMERSLVISYALQKLPLAPEWPLRAPALPQEDRARSLFMVALPPGVELSGPGLQGPLPAHKLPRWVGEKMKAAEFVTLSGSSEAALQARLLPRLDTASGVVTRSEYTTRVVGDGASLTQGTVEIEHDEALRWIFTLPTGSNLLKCSVDGAAVKPVALSDGGVEVLLAHAGPAAKTVKSTVAFSYTRTSDKLHAVDGQTALELPLTPLFIQEVLWTVEVPEAYQISGVGEGMEHAPAAQGAGPNTVRLVRRLCRNERPAAQIFYEKRGLVTTP